MSLELAAPQGAYRVVRRDILSNDLFPVGDFDPRRACDTADRHNEGRQSPEDDTMSVFDDQANLVRSVQDV